MKKRFLTKKRRISIIVAMLLCAAIGITGTVINMNRTHHAAPSADTHTAAVQIIK